MEFAGIGAMGLGGGFEDKRRGDVVPFAAIEGECFEKGGAARPPFRQFRVRGSRGLVIGLWTREQIKNGSVHMSKGEFRVGAGSGVDGEAAGQRVGRGELPADSCAVLVKSRAYLPEFAVNHDVNWGSALAVASVARNRRSRAFMRPIQTRAH